MLRRLSPLLGALILVLASGSSGCSCRQGVDIPPADDAGKMDDAGADAGPCGTDCSQVATPPCKVAVCNTGQAIGPLNTCVIVAAPKGTNCDDGKFCTMEDTCDGNGACVGGPRNDCGTQHGPCDTVICYEDSKSCSVTPAGDGSPCTLTDLCQVNGACKTGKCVGQEKTCDFSPATECNQVKCDPATGMCVPTPDPGKDASPCVLTGDLCSDGKACLKGQCVGGAPKDCTALDLGCKLGVCDPQTGSCQAMGAPLGHPCTLGIHECQLGTCQSNGDCKPSPGPDGVACNDHDACTGSEQCSGGLCTKGAPVMSCAHWYQEGFESCPAGWTLAGDWECGTPQKVGPPSAHAGSGAIATKIAGNYDVNQSLATCTATSPAIDLTMATAPKLSFWAWDQTEGGTFDGWNLKISTDGGKTFAAVANVVPAYPLTIQNEPAWGGDHSKEGWKNYSADLTAYAGKTIQLQLDFGSDGATVFPGVYVDDVVIDEPVRLPLYITTSSPLPNAYVGVATSLPIARVGGSPAATWSILPGGVNAGWLAIDPATGVLSGTPLKANLGDVSLTLHVEEPTLTSNYDDETFTFKVLPDAYYTSFEGACPNGWTLTGDWECGVPSKVGPATAYDGTQCIATKIASNYDDNQPYASTTATSPVIDLTNSPNPKMTFRMWIDTEGSTYDGVNLKVSNDGGMTFTLVSGVTPAYPLKVAGEPAWGGHQGGLGWQLMEADLSAYAGQVIQVQFAFNSDPSGTYPGVYIDEIYVN